MADGQERPTRSAFATASRAGIPYAVACLLLAISFGVLAQPLMGDVAPIVMSVFVFAGSAQFASTAVLAAGGGAGAAIAAGILLNLRYVPMGIALAPSLSGGALRRAAIGQAMIDFSWAAASRGGGELRLAFHARGDRALLPGWVAGTVVGVFAGDLIGDPAGARTRRALPGVLSLPAGRGRAAAGPAARSLPGSGSLIALVLIPFTPAGVPVIAASAAALLGLRAATAAPVAGKR